MKQVLVFILLLQGFWASGQYVANTIGAEFEVAGTYHAYSIGEPWVEKITDGTNQVTEGFFQPELMALGLSEEALSPAVGLKAFPNPAQGAVSISLEKRIIQRIRVYDVGGNMLQEIQVNIQQAVLDVSSYAPGFYFLEVFTNDSPKGIRLKIVKS